MSKTYEIMLAGFGGQGILFAGKNLAYAGMKAGCEVSWIPSYGPEMRGGTCTCSVVISNELIGCPIVSKPNILIAMNLPSLEKYEKDVANDGIVFTDSALIERSVERTDVAEIRIPATKLAADAGFPKLANIIMLGRFVKETEFVTYNEFTEAIRGIVPKSKAALLELNLKAFQIGYNYQD